MSITYTFPGFPQINQLTDRYGGVLDVNASWDCVPASLSDGLGYLTGSTYHCLELKEAVYGVNYQGGQAAADYVAYCARQGVLLAPVNGNPVQLVARAHSELAASHPVIATIPSMWGIPVSQQSGNWTTHVVCFAGYGPGTLRADNPWIAPAWQDGSDGYWEAELCDSQIWIMSRIGAPMGIPSGWTDSAGGDPNNTNGVLTAPNNLTITSGFRHLILTNGWLAENEPLTEAHYQDPCDPSDPTSGPGSSQLFEYFVLVWHQTSNTITVRPAGQIVKDRGGTNPPPPAPTPAADPFEPKYDALKAAISAALAAN